MCHCCHDDWGCYGSYHYPMRYGPRWRFYEEPTPEDRREYLEEEKRMLERRLEQIEARIAQTTK